MKLIGRALHFVFKIGDRSSSAHFYRNILGMQVLRHEEFQQGCEAQCNGAYDNRWSKTMIGYGPEDTHFVVELTYNYPVKKYERGNDFLGITIQSSEVIKRAQQENYPNEVTESGILIRAPGGYPFYIVDKSQPTDVDPVQKVTLASSDLKRTFEYWSGLVGIDTLEKTPDAITFGFGSKQATLKFIKNEDGSVNHAEAYGRIAFAIPTEQLAPLQEKMEKNETTILTKLVCLETPGKASVSVVILADPDGHEICFVGDEGFRDLSQVDPNADKELEKFIRNDKS